MGVAEYQERVSIRVNLVEFRLHGVELQGLTTATKLRDAKRRKGMDNGKDGRCLHVGEMSGHSQERRRSGSCRQVAVREGTSNGKAMASRHASGSKTKLRTLLTCPNKDCSSTFSSSFLLLQHPSEPASQVNSSIIPLFRKITSTIFLCLHTRPLFLGAAVSFLGSPSLLECLECSSASFGNIRLMLRGDLASPPKPGRLHGVLMKSLSSSPTA